MGNSWAGRLTRAARAWSVALAVVAASAAVAPPAPAEDSSAAIRELSDSSDFRVRVSAALMLGRARPAGARQGRAH